MSSTWRGHRVRSMSSNQPVQSPKKPMVLKLSIDQNDAKDLLTTDCWAPASEGLI